jgi:flagellar protein FliS
LNHQAVNAYGSTGLHSGITDASPEKLIELLLDGVTSRLNGAVAAMQAGEIAKKGELIGKALGIIDYLRAILDYEAAPEFVANLTELYSYMERRVMKANFDNDPAAVSEVVELLNEIRYGWRGIDQAGDSK